MSLSDAEDDISQSVHRRVYARIVTDLNGRVGRPWRRLGPLLPDATMQAMLRRALLTLPRSRAAAELAEPAPSRPAQRLLSLDVFRGLTITPMLLLNNPGTWSQTLEHASGTAGPGGQGTGASA